MIQPITEKLSRLPLTTQRGGGPERETNISQMQRPRRARAAATAACLVRALLGSAGWLGVGALTGEDGVEPNVPIPADSFCP